MTNEFDRQTVFVVGAGREGGIAFATARVVAQKGATVALADLAASDVDLLARKLNAEYPGRGHTSHALDVTDRAAVAEVVGRIVSDHGRIDAVVICSGVLTIQPFLEVDPEAWDKTFAVNCTGVFNVAQAVARAMVAGGGGRIVAVASNAGRVPRWATSTYGATKAAVIHLVHCMALELAQHRITVNTLCPGSTATSMAIDDKSKGDPDKLNDLVNGNLKEWRLGIPLGHLASPTDQAEAAAFLMSDAARHITGQSLCVDGGQTFF